MPIQFCRSKHNYRIRFWNITNFTPLANKIGNTEQVETHQNAANYSPFVSIDENFKLSIEKHIYFVLRKICAHLNSELERLRKSTKIENACKKALAKIKNTLPLLAFPFAKSLHFMKSSILPIRDKQKLSRCSPF
jgi:hypothetical protein